MEQDLNSPKESKHSQLESNPLSTESNTASAHARTEELAEPAGNKSGSIRPEARPHTFVIMPFGKKKGGDGSLFDFNAIYSLLIKPTLEMAGFEPFRADEETTSGDILTDMFQELLLADLCIVDMSIDNANVFYELGIRHAFRKRGIVHIQAGRAYMPFDVFNVRTIPYHITTEGIPDPAFLEKDKAAIARVVLDTWASEADAIQSPVFNLLTGLVEPNRKSLRTPLARGFWSEYNNWKERVTIAQRQKRIGDILLLTEEIKNPLIKEEAIGEAGRALANMGRNELALNQYRKGLEVNSQNLTFRREEAFHLNRLGRLDEAIVKIEGLLADYPRESEAIAYLGRIYKEMWVESWKWVEVKDLRHKTAFESYHWLIKSIDTYLKGYRFDLDHFYPGVNALTLGSILLHLADKFQDKEDPDPEIQRIRDLMPELTGTIAFCLESNAEGEKADYWTLISLAEFQVLTANKVQQVTRAYRKALTASRRNQFYLQSSIAQLEILQSLNFREEYVNAGANAINEEFLRIRKEIDDVESIPEALRQKLEKVSSNASEPLTKKSRGKKDRRQLQKRSDHIFLFTGYMISHPGKKEGYFPPEKEQEINKAIRVVLNKYNAGTGDIAFTSGLAAGSEIIFAEVCAEQGIPVEAYLPLPESQYVRNFISPGGETWVERYYKIRNHPLVDEQYQVDRVGAPKEGDDLHERNNRWALYSALTKGIDKLWLVAVWDGKGELFKDLDARLVKHMVDLMRDMGGQMEHINTSKLSRVIKNSKGKTEKTISTNSRMIKPGSSKKR